MLNWNDGKSQEFKDRTVYNVGTSVLKKTAPAVESQPKVMAAAAPSYEIPAAGDARTILLSRLTCTNCRVAENLLAKKGVAFEKYIAEENLELCRKFGIKGAPPLVVAGPAGFQTYYSVNEIKKYQASH